MFFYAKKSTQVRVLKVGNKKDLARCYSLANAIPSPLLCLTAVFGMGTGVTTTLYSPDRQGLIPEN